MSNTLLRSLAAVAMLALASVPAAAVEPFSADYSAQYMGLQANGRMTLEPAGANRWKYSLEVSGAGARLEQNTVFEAEGDQWRPVSSQDSQRGESGLAAMLVKRRSSSATYDWSSGKATWDGDVKDDRRGPVRLQRGDVDGMLMNLALVRDVQAGKPLSYRLVEDGRARRQVFRPAGTEPITVAGETRTATRVVWSNDERSITAWIVDGLPVPARILQQRGGRDHIDLTLKTLH